MECDGRRAEGLNGPRPGPTFEPPADAVSWCWAERRDCLPGGRGRTIPPEKPKVVEFGGGLLDQLVYSWKVNCKIVVVIILAFGRLIFRLSSQRTAHCNAKAGDWHYVRREETQIATVASAGWLSPPTPPPTPFFFLERLRWSRAPTLGAAPERHCGVARQGAVLAVFRELLVPIPGAPALGHHTLSSLASSLGASTTFNDRPALR